MLNFYEILKALMLSFEVDSETFMYPNARYESETLNFKKFPVCVLGTDISTTNTSIAGGGAVDESRYAFRIVTSDKWDNWDAENNQGTDGDGNTYSIYLEMKTLANSIMLKFKRENKFQTNTPFVWTMTPLFRETSNNLTGVLVQTSFTIATQFNCS